MRSSAQFIHTAPTRTWRFQRGILLGSGKRNAHPHGTVIAGTAVVQHGASRRTAQPAQKDVIDATNNGSARSVLRGPVVAAVFRHSAKPRLVHVATEQHAVMLRGILENGAQLIASLTKADLRYGTEMC